MATKPKKHYTVKDVKKAGYTLEPMKCKHCGSEEVTFFQDIAGGDAHCASCGKWQSEPKVRKAKKK